MINTDHLVNAGAFWHLSVAVRMRDGTSMLVQGPRHALDYLTNEYRNQTSSRIELACKTCLSAMHGDTSFEEARRIFSDAVEDAHLTAH